MRPPAWMARLRIARMGGTHDSRHGEKVLHPLALKVSVVAAPRQTVRHVASSPTAEIRSARDSGQSPSLPSSPLQSIQVHLRQASAQADTVQTQTLSKICATCLEKSSHAGLRERRKIWRILGYPRRKTKTFPLMRHHGHHRMRYRGLRRFWQIQ